MKNYFTLLALDLVTLVSCDKTGCTLSNGTLTAYLAFAPTHTVDNREQVPKIPVTGNAYYRARSVRSMEIQKQQFSH